MHFESSVACGFSGLIACEGHCSEQMPHLSHLFLSTLGCNGMLCPLFVRPIPFTLHTSREPPASIACFARRENSAILISSSLSGRLAATLGNMQSLRNKSPCGRHFKTILHDYVAKFSQSVVIVTIAINHHCYCLLPIPFN